MNYCKKVLKKNFNKNSVIPAEDEERFQSSNKCLICDKLFDTGDNKVRDHCHEHESMEGMLNGAVTLIINWLKNFL